MINKFKNVGSKGLFVLILTILSIILLGTYAWLTWRSSETALVLTIGDLGEINISLAPYKFNSSITPSPSYEGSDIDENKYTQIDAINTSNTNKYKVSLYYDIDTIDEELIDPSFKYTILSSTDNQDYTEYKTGNFSTAKSGYKYMILEDEELLIGTNKYYRVYLWIDSTEGDQSSMQGKVFKAELRAEYLSVNENVEDVTEFDYTGDYQIFTVPVSGYYQIEAYGAQGGYGLLNSNLTTATGGKGAYTAGKLYLNKEDKLYIYVGGKGEDALVNVDARGGYNGGGNSWWDGADDESSGSGGGATDIRYFGTTIPSDLDLLWNSSLGLNSRMMVAAGGGGGAMSNEGGSGGGLIGTIVNNSTDSAGTQTNGFSFGTGGQGVLLAGTPGGGGGSGYYGGKGGESNGNSGSGGSSFISGYAGVNAITSSIDRTHTNNTLHYSNKYFIDGEMQGGVNSGNGKAIITYIGNNKPGRVNQKLDNVRYIKDCINGSNQSTGNAWNEIQAIQNGINIALNKTVTGTGTLGTSSSATYSYEAVVDGDFVNLNSNAYISDTGLQCTTVDLGSTYNLDEIGVWHYWQSVGRTYNDNITYVSSDGSTWKHVMTKNEAETVNGKRINAYEKDTTDENAPTGTLTAVLSGNNIIATFSDAADDNSGVAEYQYLIQTDSTCPSSGYTSSVNSSYTFTVTSTDVHYICGRIKDNVGNISKSFVYSIIVNDEVAPTGVLSVSSNSTTVTASFSSVVEELSGIKEYQYLIQTDSTCPTSGYTSSTSSSHSFTDVAIGTHYVCARIVDNSENMSTYSKQIVVSKLPIFTYTSSEGGTTHELIDDGSGNWVIKIYKDGTLAVTNWGTGASGIDVFLVGGGGGGGGAALSSDSYGGGGGGGGYITTAKGISVETGNFTVIVGNGGSGGASATNGGNGTSSSIVGTGINKSAAGGYGGYGGCSSGGNCCRGGAGGAGGGAGGSGYALYSSYNKRYENMDESGGTGGSCGASGGTSSRSKFTGGAGSGNTSCYEFGGSSGNKYGAGGAGGFGQGAWYPMYGGYGTSAGGATGGGNSDAAATWYGGGGGGGGFQGNGSGGGTKHPGGNGYQGIVMIRNKR